MIFNPADEELFRAYQGTVDAHAMAYLEVHYRRYQATLSFLGTHRPARILELGAIGPYLFTLMLARRFPQAEIVLANWEHPSQKFDRTGPAGPPGPSRQNSRLPRLLLCAPLFQRGKRRVAFRRRLFRPDPLHGDA